MNICNKLTVVRIILVPLIVGFLICDTISYRYVYAGIIFLIASYTDFLDGKLARKNNLITTFGQIMDPLADKILVTSVTVYFVSANLVSPLAAILIIGREFLITSVRFLVLRNNGSVISANILGKLKTISQMIAIGSIFIFQICIEMARNLGINELLAKESLFLTTQNVLMWVAVALSCFSGGVYIYLNRKFMFLDS